MLKLHIECLCFIVNTKKDIEVESKMMFDDVPGIWSW